MVNGALFRRSREAGVPPFTADDVARTNSILIAGRWHAAPKGSSGANGSLRLRPEDWPLPTANPSQMLVVRFLSRHGHARRSALLERLNRLALLIGGGNHQAFTLDWSELRPDQLPPARGALDRCGLRERNLMKNALHGVLKEGLATGVLDRKIYSVIVGQKWSDETTKRRATCRRSPGS